MQPHREIYCVKGLWGYEQLAQRHLKPKNLFYMLITASLAFHSLLLLLVSPEDIRSLLELWNIQHQTFYLLFYATAFVTGCYIFWTVGIDRSVYRNLVLPLVTLDATIENYRHHLQQSRLTLLAKTALLFSAGSTFYYFVIRDSLALNLQEAQELLDITGSYWVIVFVNPLLNLLTASILLSVSSGNMTRAIARNINIDFFRIEDYACLTSTAVVTFQGISVLLAIIGLVLLSGVSPELTKLLLYLVVLVIVVGVILLIRDSYPTVILANRFQAAINTEKEHVRSAINGDYSALATSLLSGDEKNLRKTDLINYLVTLNNLSPWPVGPHLKRIVVFGLIPPIAWTLAAVVENTIY